MWLADITYIYTAQGWLYLAVVLDLFSRQLKGELVEERDYLTREEARADVFQYIEGFYNRRRLHSSIGYCTPEQKAAEYTAVAMDA